MSQLINQKGTNDQVLSVQKVLINNSIDMIIYCNVSHHCKHLKGILWTFMYFVSEQELTEDEGNEIYVTANRKEDDPMFPQLFNLNIYCHPNRIKAYQHIVFVLHHFQLVLLFGECIHSFGQVYFKLLQYLRGEKKDIRWI